MGLTFYLCLTVLLFMDMHSTIIQPSSTTFSPGELVPTSSLLSKVGVASLSPRPAPFPRRKFALFALLLIAGVERNPGPPYLQFGLLNVRSAVNKAPLIQDMIVTSNLEFTFLTETWFKRSDPSAIVEDIAPNGFSTFHSFRDGRKKSRGSGISLVYRNNIKFNRLSLPFKPSTFKCLSVFTTIQNTRFNFVCIYRPPPSPTSVFFDELALLTDALDLLPGNHCLLGDFNCPWETAGCLNPKLTDFFNDRDLCQLVPEPTRLENLLDLIIRQGSSVVGTRASKPRLTNVVFSDHRLVTHCLTIPISPPRLVTFTHRNIKNIDLTKFEALLHTMPCFNQTPSDE